MSSITIRVDIGKYKYIDLPVDEALKLLELIKNDKGETMDLAEAIRYIRNFDEFFAYMKKKFKDFITPPKDHKDLVLGKVVVDKIKLYVEDKQKRVLIVFDRRVDVEYIRKFLEKMGYASVYIQKELF